MVDSSSAHDPSLSAEERLLLEEICGEIAEKGGDGSACGEVREDARVDATAEVGFKQLEALTVVDELKQKNVVFLFRIHRPEPQLVPRRHINHVTT